jgi:hypothetical protein
MQDKCNYTFKEPETAYVDDYCSYASNEIAINWNAPLVYLVNAIEALQYEAGFSGKVLKRNKTRNKNAQQKRAVRARHKNVQ